VTSYVTLLSVANAVADLGADIVRTNRPEATTEKGDRDMVTEIDVAIERAVRAYLSRTTPHIGFLGEEEGRSGPEGDQYWALDPIDGTANFVHGNPLCAISIALIEGDQPVLGVVDAPFLGSRYTASRGNGAYENLQPIRCSSTTRLHDAIVAIGDYAIGANAAQRNRVRLALTAELASTVQRIRMLGSAALDLAWTAAGKLDAAIMLSNKPWDTAAGIAIATEAGVRIGAGVESPHPMNATEVLAATPGIQDDLLRLLATVKSDCPA
jgi:myo-inositol-1(or 4)-monophosphatase